MDFEKLQFGGKLTSIAENVYAASFGEDHDNALISELYRRYVNDGKPADLYTWACRELGALFLCMSDSPKWVEATPMWPFLEGRPMVFIGQLDVSSNPVAESNLAANSVLYVFGKRIAVSDSGWEMRYKVVEQRKDLGFADAVARRRPPFRS